MVSSRTWRPYVRPGTFRRPESPHRAFAARSTSFRARDSATRRGYPASNSRIAARSSYRSRSSSSNSTPTAPPFIRKRRFGPAVLVAYPAGDVLGEDPLQFRVSFYRPLNRCIEGELRSREFGPTKRIDRHIRCRRVLLPDSIHSASPPFSCRRRPAIRLRNSGSLGIGSTFPVSRPAIKAPLALIGGGSRPCACCCVSRPAFTARSSAACRRSTSLPRLGNQRGGSDVSRTMRS